MANIPIIWLTTLVTKRELGKHFECPTYCPMGQARDKHGHERVKIGFCAVQKSKQSSLATEEEMRQIDDYRRSHKIFPTPFK